MEWLFRFRNWIFIGYMIGSYILLLAIGSVFNGGFYVSIKWLWLPLAVLIFGITWWHRDFLRRKCKGKGRLYIWLNAVVSYFIILFMSWPYVMGINALTGRGETITYRGAVVRKFVTHGRTKGYHFNILDEATGEVVSLNCPEEKYDSIIEGRIREETFSLGGLGLPYRNNFGRPLQPRLER